MPFIVGLQLFVPNCLTLSEFLAVLANGQVVTPDFASLRMLMRHPWNEHRAMRMADALRLPTMFAFDREHFGITATDAAIMDPQQRKLMEGIVNAFFDAGVTPQIATDYGPVACYVGAGVANYLKVTGQDRAAYFSQETRNFIANDLSALALRSSYFLNFQGPSLTVLSTCSSSLVAFHLASCFIRSGDGHFAVAAGAHIDFESGYFTSEEGGILSPHEACRPLSAEADGTYFSNGICIALLASETAVNAFGLRPYCRVDATGINNDGRAKPGYTAPSLIGQASLIKRVSEAAHLTRRPDLIELHGTGTTVGDPIEMQALAQAYEHLNISPPSTVGSVKSNFGHLSSSAGLLGITKAALALRVGRCFATVGCLPLTDKFIFSSSGFKPAVDELPLSCDSGICAVSAFGIGGTNAHAVLSAYPSRVMEEIVCNQLIVLVGSHSESLMQAQCALLSELFLQQGRECWKAFAHTCNRLFGREKYQSLVRIGLEHSQTILLGPLREMTFTVMPANNRIRREELKSLIESLLHKSEENDDDILMECNGIVYSLRNLERYSTMVPLRGANSMWHLGLKQLEIALGLAELSPSRRENITVVNGVQKAFSRQGYIL